MHHAMYDARHHASDNRPGLRHVLAGLQAGVLGSLVMFLWVMLGSVWNGRSAWVVPNLFSTTFFGNEAYRNQFLKTSWVGVAVTIAVYGLLGVIWGCIWREERPRWLSAYGAITGLAVYFLFYHFVWRHVNPIVTLYAPDRQLQTGHLLWGMVLARSPLFARRIADAADETEFAGSQPAPEPEIRSGELIR
ncbi:MAG: hypothetical protein M3N93_09155 [Acidobacteriota bacterium]|nr:hypothetical protein [Acidobacteriota bacterium]